MGIHDNYGKQLLREAFGAEIEIYGEIVQVDFGAGQPGRIDGVLRQLIAIEVESRTSKQVRGAVLDLLLHRCPKKLLLLLPVHMTDAEVTKAQSENILSKYLGGSDFRVVVLKGTGSQPDFLGDVEVVRGAVDQLIGTGDCEGRCP